MNSLDTDAQLFLGLVIIVKMFKCPHSMVQSVAKNCVTEVVSVGKDGVMCLARTFAQRRK